MADADHDDDDQDKKDADKDTAAPAVRPMNDAYTGMLLISLLVLAVGCLLLYLDFAQYPSDKPKDVSRSAVPVVEPKGGAPVEEKKEEEGKKDDGKKDDGKKDDAKKAALHADPPGFAQSRPAVLLPMIRRLGLVAAPRPQTL